MRTACVRRDCPPECTSMKIRIWISAAALASIGIAALAHSGAMGEVKERMDGMSAMQKQIKALAPIMRGLSDYDADTVRAAADIVTAHSGEALKALFPEGSNAPPSEALDTIWEDWNEFAALADALAASAEGMKRAADNGIGESAVAGQASGMMASSASSAAVDADRLAEMPVNASFTAMTKICSSCHSKFRAERF